MAQSQSRAALKAQQGDPPHGRNSRRVPARVWIPVAVSVTLVAAGIWLGAARHTSTSTIATPPAAAREAGGGVPANTIAVADQAGQAETAATPQSLPPTAVAAEPAVTAVAPRADTEAARSRSLLGADPDGLVAFDAQGNLVIDLALRRRFDFYLTAIGEVKLPTIRGWLRDDLAREHSPARVDTVMQAFNRYVDYLLAAAGVTENTKDDLNGRFAQLKDLRRSMLGQAMAAAFYGEEEWGTQLALERTRSPDAPEAVAAVAEVMPQVAVADHNAELERSGASAEVRHAERTQRFGAEAADRLAQLDVERLVWQRRLDAAKQEIGRISGTAGSNDAARNSAIDTYLARNFSETERLRVRVLLSLN